MRQVFSILFGAAFTVVASLAIGRVLLRRLRLALYREEAALFGFLAGAGLLSVTTFFLCVAGIAWSGVFLVAGAGAIALAYRQRAGKAAAPLPSGPRSEYKVILLLVLGVFFLICFVNALAPEVSPDGSGYHLGNVARLWRRHGFVWDYHSMYSYLSQGMEMLFLVAYSFGRHSSAAMVHFAFLVTLSLLIICYGRRCGFPGAGLFAAVLVATSPVVGKSGSSAYNDLAVAALAFAVFYLLQIWDENREPNLLILIGLLSGFAYGVKYPAVLSLWFAIGFVCWRGVRRRELAMLCATAAAGIVPWVVRNWVWVGNPFAPFGNSWFSNQFFHPGMEAMYLADLKHYIEIQHWWEIPRELLWRGRGTGGFLGPIYILTPFSLLASRWRAGRQLLLGGLIFALPAYFNTGSRFLIPALPFVALALGMVLAKVPPALPAAAVLAGIAGWPAVTSRYADRTAWRVTGIPVAAALRIEPETQYLNVHLKDYSLVDAIEILTPPNARIFSLDYVAEAYVDRTFIVGYQSAVGNFVTDVLAVPLDSNVRPKERLRFRFLQVATRAVRAVQTANGTGYWSINEMHIAREGRELPRSVAWRVKAWPNGGDAPMAFDNSYATRWSSWQRMEYGMFVAVDFGKAEVIDEVWLDQPLERQAKVEVEILSQRGQWIPLTDFCEIETLDVPSGLRRAATLAIKGKGIRYLLVRNTDFYADDMRKYAAFWGVTELRRTERASLYLIQ